MQIIEMKNDDIPVLVGYSTGGKEIILVDGKQQWKEEVAKQLLKKSSPGLAICFLDFQVVTSQDAKEITDIMREMYDAKKATENKRAVSKNSGNPDNIRRKNQIIEAFRNAPNTNVWDTSVLFLNETTGNVKFYNGISEEFESVSKEVFEELLADGSICEEKCICMGDVRYILK